MKEKLSLKNYFFLSSMFFGMYFGAGNLIFPVFVGSQAGQNIIPAFLGFFLTAICLPLLGIIALSVSKCEGIHRLQDKVGKAFGAFFTLSLYLAIGPLFAIPRSCTVAYTVSLEAFIPFEYRAIATPLFSFIFFNIVIFFAIKPKSFMLLMGRLFNPFFITILGFLVLSIFLKPVGDYLPPTPLNLFVGSAVLKGALEGYNTLDVLSSLAFGILLIISIHNLGISDKKTVAKISIRTAFITFAMMTVAYILLFVAGASSSHLISSAKNGGEALQIIAKYYFGMFGSILIGIIITLACLKTSISLVTASAASFEKMAGGRLSYHFFAIIFSLISFAFSNFGLSGIIKFSIPFIIILYPLAIMIILLLFLDRALNLDKSMIRLTLFTTTIFSIVDSLRVLSLKNLSDIPTMETPISTFFNTTFRLDRFIPFFNIKLSWIIFGFIGIVLSIIVSLLEKLKNKPSE